MRKNKIIMLSFLTFVLLLILCPTLKNVNAKEEKGLSSETIKSPAPWNPEFMNYDAPDGYLEEDKSTFGTEDNVTIPTGNEGDKTIDVTKEVNNANGIYTTASDENRTEEDADGKIGYNERRWEDGLIAVPL